MNANISCTSTFNLQTTQPPNTDADFLARCSAPGVLKCIGFDSASDFIAGTTIFPADDGQIRAIRDTSTRASGTSALRFDIPPFSSSNSSGHFRGLFGQDFGPGQTFYVQWRQRFSPDMLNTNFAGSNGFKQHIFWHGSGGSCTDVQLVTQNIEQRGFPQMYTACGARGLNYQLPDGDWVLESGGFYCTNRMDQPGENDCAYYQPNRWLTFYYQVTVGSWGQANSVVKAWMGYEGEPLRQFINISNLRIDNDSPSTKKFRQVDLLPYQTGKSSSQNHPTAYTWYDELIISSSPIAAPGAVTSNPSIPLAPSALVVQ
jgi:hypothetical protein